MRCYCEHSAQINLLVLWLCSCSGAVKISYESISYICCSFWGPTEWSTADICSGLTGSTNLWSFLEEQNDHVLFLQDIWWWCAINRYTSLFFQLYWLSFLLLCLTNAILLLGYQKHTQRIALPARDCNWKHVHHTTYPFSRKSSLCSSLGDRPHHQGWRKASRFHFSQKLMAFVRS